MSNANFLRNSKKLITEIKIKIGIIEIPMGPRWVISFTLPNGKCIGHELPEEWVKQIFEESKK